MGELLATKFSDGSSLGNTESSAWLGCLYHWQRFSSTRCETARMWDKVLSH